LSVIRQLYPDRRERATALGAWSAISGLALALGPVVGGLLVGLGDWRSVFRFNLALGVVLLVAVWALVPASRDARAGRIDLGVFAIFFLTALYLDVGLNYSGWKLAGMFAPMAAAIVVGGLAAGPWVARRGSRPPMVLGCALAAAGMLLARVEVGEGASLSFAL